MQQFQRTQRIPSYFCFFIFFCSSSFTSDLPPFLFLFLGHSQLYLGLTPISALKDRSSWSLVYQMGLRRHNLDRLQVSKHPTPCILILTPFVYFLFQIFCFLQLFPPSLVLLDMTILYYTMYTVIYFPCVHENFLGSDLLLVVEVQNKYVTKFLCSFENNILFGYK